MATPSHTYGPTCHLARIVKSPDSKHDDDLPPMKAQFFYSSPLPIDDPLSAVPPPAESDSKSANHPPRPFAAYDNSALETVWLSLASKQDRKHHNKLKNIRLKPLTKSQADRRATIVQELVTKHSLKHDCEDKDHTDTKFQKGDAKKATKETVPTDENTRNRFASSATAMGMGCDCCPECQNGSCAALSPSGPHKHSSHLCDDQDYDPYDESVSACCSDLEKDVRNAQPMFAGVLKRRESKVHQEMLIVDIMVQIKQQRKSDSAAKLENKGTAHLHSHQVVDSLAIDTKNQSKKKGKAPRRSEASEAGGKIPKEQNESEEPQESDQSKKKDVTATTNAKSPKIPVSVGSLDAVVNMPLSVPGNTDAGTTGQPFKRAPSRHGNIKSSAAPSIQEASNEDAPGTSKTEDNQHERLHIHRCRANEKNSVEREVPVGVSRLHLVKLPALQMTPIYWSPVHDVAAVTRGTWFYRDTMYPVEPAVANQLESGYKDLRPWSQTWTDELNSAVEVGAAGEEKVTHRLWPEESTQKLDEGTNNVDSSSTRSDYATDPYCAARCFHSEVAAAGSVDPLKPDEKLPTTVELVKRYPNSHVVYRDAKNAFILKPSLLPSEYFGRRPVSKIRRNMTVGVPVVRGFDWKAWEKLHPSKKSLAAKSAEQAAPIASTTDGGPKSACPLCRMEETRPQATDLVLVVHGIGQKLSERMESFHFTHAINAFRRSVNVELGNTAVQKVLRDDLGGIMVLPVNWRSHLTFEEGGPNQPGDKIVEQNADDFGLKDITPETIPAVRNLISDVLLDIPYYLSQHKPKMIEALIFEANRVYRLWCKNNPDFEEKGRVHLIAHSLGSAMALDVLSKQPTSVGHLDMKSKKVQKTHFDFNTTNLFFAGSPAGFFLLLDKGKLVPRSGRKKPGADLDDDKVNDITGDAGTYGCLAVDNLYNVIHYNDPIAYRLNATVDPMYAASLKIAEVPTSTTGWLDAVSNALRVLTPGAASVKSEMSVGQLPPKPAVTRLPSQLEMEVHDFTREELAEKKFLLLNDNGQIDYFLATGGGPLEIQYLNMLGAHSSYWTSPDFVRMLVTEVGRKPGKSSALPNMKAVRVSHQKKKGEK